MQLGGVQLPLVVQNGAQVQVGIKVIGVGFELLLEGRGRPFVISGVIHDDSAEGVKAGQLRVEAQGRIDVGARPLEGLGSYFRFRDQLIGLGGIFLLRDLFRSLEAFLACGRRESSPIPAPT